MNDLAETRLEDSRRRISAWIERTQRAADPAAQSRQTLQEVAGLLQEGNAALRAVLDESQRSDELERRIADYGHTLSELKSLLLHIETSLRVRAVILSQKRARMQALDSWASLARNIN